MKTKVCDKCEMDISVSLFRKKPLKDDRNNWCNICRHWYSKSNKYFKKGADINDDEHTANIYKKFKMKDKFIMERAMPTDVNYRIKDILEKRKEQQGNPNSEYASYIRSKEWRIKRKEKLVLQTSCERCQSDVNLQVHHRTYDNFKNETMEDLEVLCKYCHRREHKMFVSSSETEIQREPLKTGDQNIYFIKYERGNQTYTCHMIGTIVEDGQKYFEFKTRKDGANDITIIYSKIVEMDGYDITFKKQSADVG